MAFADQGEFEAMKMLVVGKLHAMMNISFVLKMLEPFLSYRCLNKSRNEERRRKIHTFVFSCLLCGFWTLMSLADHKGTQRGCLPKKTHPAVEILRLCHLSVYC